MSYAWVGILDDIGSMVQHLRSLFRILVQGLAAGLGDKAFGA